MHLVACGQLALQQGASVDFQLGALAFFLLTQILFCRKLSGKAVSEFDAVRSSADEAAEKAARAATINHPRWYAIACGKQR